MLQVWTSEEPRYKPFFTLLEVATREAIFPNTKLCFVLNMFCVTPLGLKGEDFLLKSGILAREFEIC